MTAGVSFGVASQVFCLDQRLRGRHRNRVDDDVQVFPARRFHGPQVADGIEHGQGVLHLPEVVYLFDLHASPSISTPPGIGIGFPALIGIDDLVDMSQ